MNCNVFQYSYIRRYYLRHPFKWWRETISNFKAAWRRATKGWCHTDCWEFGYWFLQVVPDMIDFLADKGQGYPDNDKFPTPESWSAHLHLIAALLRNAREDRADLENEYYPAYQRMLDNGENCEHWTDENGNDHVRWKDTEIGRNYHRRANEIAEKQDRMINEALRLLAETPLKAIWD